MSTVTFPWQQNGLQALSIPNAKSEFPLFALAVHLVSEGISEGGGGGTAIYGGLYRYVPL